MTDKTNWKKARKSFLVYWTLEKVKNMTLEEYTNTEKDNSFTYWLETKTQDVIGFGGGSSYKFGVFKRSSNAKITDLRNFLKSDQSELEYDFCFLTF